MTPSSLVGRSQQDPANNRQQVYLRIADAFVFPIPVIFRYLCQVDCPMLASVQRMKHAGRAEKHANLFDQSNIDVKVLSKIQENMFDRTIGAAIVY